jgi:hypothetical protein
MKSNNYYIFFGCVCARALMRACGACECAYLRVGSRASACMEPCLASRKCVCVILWRHLWPLWLHEIFRHYLINGTIFGEMLSNLKHVFWFFLQCLSKTFRPNPFIRSRDVPCAQTDRWTWRSYELLFAISRNFLETRKYTLRVITSQSL